MTPIGSTSSNIRRAIEFIVSSFHDAACRPCGHPRSLGRRDAAELIAHEALERFVPGEPLHRVHECVFGVLALESEPVDPRP
jgi:hypothetical protein